MSGGFSLDDYVDVAERIRLFYDRYPDGRLTTVAHDLYHVGERTFVFCQAHAYRAPDDPQPCTGTAWEPIPGPTPYTRDSEIMNAETAAWGRAIVAAGIPSQRIASRQEAEARKPTAETLKDQRKLTDAQMRNIHAIINTLEKGAAPRPEKFADQDWETVTKAYIRVEFGKESRKDLTRDEAGTVIEWLKAHEAAWKAAA